MSATTSPKEPYAQKSMAETIAQPNEILGAMHPASSSLPESGAADYRTGIERAFDVIRHHTVHTKGYVMTALQFIEEFGNANDKAILSGLLQEKNQSLQVPPAKKKTSKKK